MPIKFNMVKDFIGQRMLSIPQSVVSTPSDNLEQKINEMNTLVKNNKAANYLLQIFTNQIKADIKPKKLDDLPDTYELTPEAEGRFQDLKQFVVSTFHV